MMTSPATSTGEQVLYCTLELSKNSWLLAIQFPGRDNPSLHPIMGGDADRLMAKLDAARERLGKFSGRVPKVILCYEAGYDGFWLARFLGQRGIECLIMEPASLQVNRKARRVKTDRIDVEKLLHALIAWCRGERHVCSMVGIPSVEEEDLRRSHRERDRLVRERTAHINRIKGLLFGQGIRGINVKRHYKTLVPADLVTRDGRRPKEPHANFLETHPATVFFEESLEGVIADVGRNLCHLRQRIPVYQFIHDLVDFEGNVRGHRHQCFSNQQEDE